MNPTDLKQNSLLYFTFHHFDSEHIKIQTKKPTQFKQIERIIKTNTNLNHLPVHKNKHHFLFYIIINSYERIERTIRCLINEHKTIGNQNSKV